MTSEERSSCHKIIHSAATAAAGVGAGLAQIPGSDNAVIVPIQVGMVVALGKVFGISITESAALTTLTTAGASVAGRGISQFLIGWIPDIDNAINASTAFAITESLGWFVAEDFSRQSNK